MDSADESGQRNPWPWPALLDPFRRLMALAHRATDNCAVVMRIGPLSIAALDRGFAPRHGMKKIYLVII